MAHLTGTSGTRFSLRSTFVMISMTCFGLAVFRVVDFNFHRFLAVMAISIVLLFLAYQGIGLVLDIAQDLTDAINGETTRPNQRQSGDD